MIPARIIRQLNSLDWDFAEHLPGTSKALHWYPGTFPSELPTTLIQALSTPNNLVFDPYSGIGTTGLEALRQGRKAWLVENNPIGCLASYVASGLILLKSINPLLPSILIKIIRENISIISSQEQLLDRLETDDHIPLQVDSYLSTLIRPIPIDFLRNLEKQPNQEMLSEWIEIDTLSNIMTIFNHFDVEKYGYFGRLLTLCMTSAVLRPASSQTQSWGHIADNVRPKVMMKKEIFTLCQQWLTRSERVIKNTNVVALHDFESVRLWISSHNWMLDQSPIVVPEIMVDLLLTSPPYAGAIDYSLSQRLSLYLLGYSEMEITQLSRVEIGARRRRTQSTSQGKWALDLVHSLSIQVGYLDPQATLAFVLPHKDAGREIGPSSIEQYLLSIGRTKTLELERSIRQIKARQSWTSIKKEIVQIYGISEH